MKGTHFSIGHHLTGTWHIFVNFFCNAFENAVDMFNVLLFAFVTFAFLQWKIEHKEVMITNSWNDIR